MKTMTRSLLYLALVSATGNTLAQDPHAGHRSQPAPAGNHPHASHAQQRGTAMASDPHSGHAASPTSPAQPGMPTGQDARMEHASHAMPQPADPHAGHASAVAEATENDSHTDHARQSGSVMANDPHAGHGAPPGSPAQPGMPVDHAVHMDHASHAMPQPVDPHAGHAMDMQAGGPVDSHAGHAMHGGHAPPPPAPPAGAGTHGAHGEHTGPGSAATQVPRTPIPVPTAADLAAAFPTLAPHAMEHAPGFNSLVLFDHLETWNNAHGSGQAWAAKGWFGGDIDRLWLRSDGQRSAGRLEAWSLDALHGHAISPWWDVVAGVRHDGGSTRGLTRAAIGVQGLAPYKFEFSATAYLGGQRRAELDVEAEYTLLLSNRLILQPSLEASVAADDDPLRGVGRGLGRVEAGLRLRYEITRRFAPYIGFVHERRFGRTADLHRDAGEATRDSRWVAGVRFWF